MKTPPKSDGTKVMLTKFLIKSRYLGEVPIGSHTSMIDFVCYGFKKEPTIFNCCAIAYSKYIQPNIIKRVCKVCIPSLPEF